MSMPAKRPRVTFVLDAQVLHTLRRLSAVQHRSVSRIVAEMVTALEPGLVPIADLGEAMEAADAARRAGMERAVLRGEPELQAAMAHAVAVFAKVSTEIDDAWRDLDPPPSNRGVSVR